jgi:hypothetical protein
VVYDHITHSPAPSHRFLRLKKVKVAINHEAMTRTEARRGRCLPADVGCWTWTGRCPQGARPLCWTGFILAVAATCVYTVQHGAPGAICVCAPPGVRRQGGRRVLRLRGGEQDASPKPAHRKQPAHSAAAEPDRDASARTGGAGGRRDDAQCGAYRGKWSQKCKASFLVLSADGSTVYNPHYTERHDVIFEAWSVRADTPIPSQGRHYFEVRMWQDDKALAPLSSSHATSHISCITCDKALFCA